MSEVLRIMAKSIQEQVSGAEKNAGTGSLDEGVARAINTVFFVVAIVAVVMIIIGGVNYAISQGDSERMKRAKNTIMYSLIGLIIVLLAFAITNFVLTHV